MLPKLKELAPVLRNTRGGGVVADAAKAVPRKDIAVYDSLNPYGRPVKEAKPKAAKDATVKERIKSLREKYLGRTPGKNSRTGKEVQDRMRAEDKLRENEVTGATEFQASDGNWYDISQADMSHKTDAVTWWNETGRQYGAKSPEVRSWMLDSNNYVLDHYSVNRSAGSILGQTTRYFPPMK